MCVNVLLTGLLVFTPLLKFTFFCVSIIKIHTGYLLSIIKRNMPNQNIRLLTVNGCLVTTPILLNCTYELD